MSIERDGGDPIFVPGIGAQHDRFVILQHQDRFCRARTELNCLISGAACRVAIVNRVDLHLDLHHHFVHQIDGRFDRQI